MRQWPGRTGILLAQAFEHLRNGADVPISLTGDPWWIFAGAAAAFAAGSGFTFTVFSISNAAHGCAETPAAWRTVLGGDAPAGTVAAGPRWVMSMPWRDRPGRCGATDQPTLWGTWPTAAVGNAVGVEQVVELTGGARQFMGKTICKVLVERLCDGVALQGTVDARTHEFGVPLLEFTGQSPGRATASPSRS